MNVLFSKVSTQRHNDVATLRHNKKQQKVVSQAKKSHAVGCGSFSQFQLSVSVNGAINGISIYNCYYILGEPAGSRSKFCVWFFIYK